MTLLNKDNFLPPPPPPSLTYVNNNNSKKKKTQCYTFPPHFGKSLDLVESIVLWFSINQIGVVSKALCVRAHAMNENE